MEVVDAHELRRTLAVAAAPVAALANPEIRPAEVAAAAGPSVYKVHKAAEKDDDVVQQLTPAVSHAATLLRA